MIITDSNKIFCAFWALTAFLVISACQPQKSPDAGSEETVEMQENPPAAGFDTVNSHAQAIAVADKVMMAMGGRQAWDETRYLAWDFFGARKLIWDKHQGRVRIDFPDKSVYLVNVKDEISGKVWQQGMEITDPDSLNKYLTRGKNIWINDSYWLVMPFKLKDSGVTLKYLDLGETEDGTMSHILEMTFRGVGVTPENRYLVYVDTATNLVNQWAFFREAAQDSADFVRPWGNYQPYGSILLCDERGERDLSALAVYEELPDEVFDSFEAVDLH